MSDRRPSWGLALHVVKSCPVCGSRMAWLTTFGAWACTRLDCVRAWRT